MMATAALELGLVGAVRLARAGRSVRKAALAAAAQSAEPEMAAPLAARAARAPAHAVTVMYVAQETVAPLVTRATRTQMRAVQRVGGEAVLPRAHEAAMEAMRARSNLVTVEAARAAADDPGAAAKGEADCPAIEVTEAASAPPAMRSWHLPRRKPEQPRVQGKRNWTSLLGSQASASSPQLHRVRSCF